MNEDYREKEEQEVNNDFKDKLMVTILDYESFFLKSKKDFKIISSEYWGMLLLANKLKIIDGERMIYLFGEFTSKAMDFR